MPLIELVIILLVIGLALYGINRWFPADPKIKYIINLVVIVAVVIFLLKVFGVWSYLSRITVGR